MKIIRAARRELNMYAIDPASVWTRPGLFRYT